MKLSFYKRVVLLLCGLIFLVQFFNLSAILTTISDDVRSEMREDLLAASELVDQLVQKRSDLLLTSATILAADFGFRSAIASGDDATVLSALGNNIDRIAADLATFVTLDGNLLGTSPLNETDRDTYLALTARADLDGTATATLVIDGFAREVVSVPVKAPLTIGWLVLGFSLNDTIAKSLSSQVGMHVTFASGTSSYKYFGSSLDHSLQELLPNAMSKSHQTNLGLVTTLEQEEFLTQVVKISGKHDGVVSLLHTSLDTALASYRAVRNRLLMFMAMSLCVALAIGLWFAHGVTRPIKLLSIAALRIREGDYQTDLDNCLDSKRNDELGELVKTFDEMQSGIAEREALITHHAYYDDLTQLPNRYNARKQLKKLIENQLLEDCNIGLVLLGIDRYKEIIETLGHTVGDELILALSKRLRLAHESSTVIARVSTDEFLILLKDCDFTCCNTSAIKIINTLEVPLILGDAELIPNLSAGLVWIPKHADNADNAIRRASIALTDARDANSPTAYYQTGRDENHMRRLSIVADLKRAVQHDELTLHFQPKINMRNMQVGSVEALVRWIHPEHGFLPPDEFIELAESSGNIGLLTQWVLNTVIKQLSHWEAQGISLKAAVNLSALDLQDESLFSRIQALLELHNVPTSRLILEVTESAMIRDTEQALTTLRKMRASGLTISIDDFGTGYSSLAKLKDLPIDELKIDRAFVSDIEPGTTEAMIIKAIIDLGHSMNLSVISEGVETQAEWNLLEKLGNDAVQGYLISKPLCAADFTTWWLDRYRTDKHAAA